MIQIDEYFFRWVETTNQERLTLDIQISPEVRCLKYPFAVVLRFYGGFYGPYLEDHPVE